MKDNVMKVCELIEMLEQLPGDAEVQLGMQPSYPLAHKIAGVMVELQESVGDVEGEELDVIAPDEVEYYNVEDKIEKVWIIDGGQTDNPYNVPCQLFNSVW